tara:strand:- start:3216 stop:4136 length:921 start_codon:yes stop_codon:yes gene_type:complete
MCGIAGIMFKSGDAGKETGTALIDMLGCIQHRGPDSTGFALYGDDHTGELKLRFHLNAGKNSNDTIDLIKAALKQHSASLIDDDHTGDNYCATVSFSGDLQKFAYAMEHAAPDATVLSIGEKLDIVKDVGGAQDVDNRYDVGSFTGTHGLGHVRLATESDVKPEAAHPFWATGFSDVAIVHNGQITNYWKMRRRLERRDFEFRTDNDSELIAVYLADKMAQGTPLKKALETSITDLDGTFSFLVSTKDEIGYAKDNLAAKPMIMYENEDIIAIASEEVSLNRLFPGQALDTHEPPPGSFATWSRST